MSTIPAVICAYLNLFMYKCHLFYLLYRRVEMRVKDGSQFLNKYGEVKRMTTIKTENENTNEINMDLADFTSNLSICSDCMLNLFKLVSSIGLINGIV